jgi:hypothetical protein
MRLLVGVWTFVSRPFSHTRQADRLIGTYFRAEHIRTPCVHIGLALGPSVQAQELTLELVGATPGREASVSRDTYR